MNLVTSGEKRAYSFLLPDSCDCHTHSPIRILKTPKTNHNSLQLAAEKQVRKSCFNCSNDSSPFWWPIKRTFDADGENELSAGPFFECQKCKWGFNHRKINR